MGRMATVAERPEIERALAARVRERIAGHGVSRLTVDKVIGRVLDSLEERAAGSTAESPEPSMVVVVTARSLPDVASKLRRDLEREGVVIQNIGIGSAGQHTVVTMRLPGSARAALERVTERSRYSMSYLNGVV